MNRLVSPRPARRAAPAASARRHPARSPVLLVRWLVAVIPSIALASMAAAEERDEDPFDRPGFYVGLGIAYQYNVFRDTIEDEIVDALAGDLPPGTTLDTELDDSFGLRALAGYRVASFFALELEYEWIDRYDIDFQTNAATGSGRLYGIEGHTLTANTKWILPFWRIQPYLLLGGGLAVSDVDRGRIFGDPVIGPILANEGIDVDDGRSTSAAGRAGLGLDLYLTRNIVLNAEADLVLTTLKEPDLQDIDDLNYMSFGAGLQYRF